ncbi:MAG: prephenate dehydrogenase/arogenate dehydrogenase family protein, partial [Alphaproteobacteria bacterium]
MAEGQQKVLFNRVALIGLGLIGSSLARAIKRHGLAGEIVGHARSKETREVALGLGFIDRAAVTAAAAVKGADLVVIAVPVGVTGAIAQEIAPALGAGAIVTDVGSVKGAV